MKTMTKKALLLLLFFQLGTLFLSATPVFRIAESKVKDILLKGELNEKQIPRSLIIPIKATLQSNSTVELQFYCWIEGVTISILREGEIVEQRTCSVSSSQIERFDLNGLGSGGYSLTLSTPQGTLLFGDFIVEIE